jgi:alkaline phosphatase D
MVQRFPRRQFLKTLGLTAISPMLSKLAFAAEDDWVLGFGSCMDQRKSQSYWSVLNARPFSHFAFLGDNLYPERDTLPELTNAYSRLAVNEGLAALRSRVSVSATWDDHDFGADNADSTLPFKSESMALFRSFWQQNYASEDDGVYSSRFFEHQGRKIHLILLDARFNRTAYQPAGMEPDELPYENGIEAEPVLLGAKQWEWLDAQLDIPADLKIICSSIQVLSFDHRFEKWMNYPAEHERLMKALARISAPTLLLSGDRHLHEISRSQLVSGRTIYDFTSSGFNKAEGLSRFERNRLRVQRNLDDGFGEVRIKWIDGVPSVTMSMIDKLGAIRFSHTDVLV